MRCERAKGLAKVTASVNTAVDTTFTTTNFQPPKYRTNKEEWLRVGRKQKNTVGFNMGLVI